MSDLVSASYDVGGIQPIGALIGFKRSTEKVALVSENLNEFVPALQVDETFGKSVEQVVGAKLLHSIRNAQTLPNIHEKPEILGPVTVAGVEMDISVFDAGKCTVLELKEPDAPVSALDLIRDISRVSDRMKGAESLDILFSRILSLMRILSGYDRVQVLRHQDKQTGVVIAESRRGRVSETLGMEMDFAITPHEDALPPHCVIHDIEENAVMLRFDSAGRFELPLLTFPQPVPAILEHLSKQEMRAQLTVPLTLEGRFWGTLQFQHRRPRRPSSRFGYVCRVIQPLLEAWLARWDMVTHHH